MGNKSSELKVSYSCLYRIMEKRYTYKKQGDGRDSWRCDEIEDGVIVNSYMVFEDPNPKPIDISGVDIDTLTDEQLLKLKTRLGL